MAARSQPVRRSRDSRGIQRSDGNGAACHAQMYVMGTLLRHGGAAQKAAYLPVIASGSCASRPSG